VLIGYVYFTIQTTQVLSSISKAPKLCDIDGRGYASTHSNVCSLELYDACTAANTFFSHCLVLIGLSYAYATLHCIPHR